MPKYLSNRFKVTPQSQLNADRYRYLSIENAEPNLGDPLVGPSSVGAKPVVAGQQYMVVSVDGNPGERYWIPNQGGIIPGSISVFEESVLVGGASSTTQLNFLGNSVTATGIAGPPPGIKVDVTIAPPGNDTSVLFKNSGDFATDSRFTFDNGLFAAGDRITVGSGGTVITTTSAGLVGINTTNPTQELHVQGDIRLTGTIYDSNNQPGEQGYLITKTADGGILWVRENSIITGAGGTIGQIQFHNTAGLVDGADNFYYDFTNQRVGIGSTIPTTLLDVLGVSTFKGGVFIDNLVVSGVSTFSQLIDANGGIDIFGHTETDTLNVSGLSTFAGNIDANGNLDVDGQTDLDVLNVSDTAQFTKTTDNTLGNANTGAVQIDGGVGINKNLTVGQTIQSVNLNVTGVAIIETIDITSADLDNLIVNNQATINNLRVTGVGTFDNIKLDTNTISTLSGNLILDSSAGTTQINDAIYINDTTDSTSKDTGSIITEGGVGIEKRLNVGGQVNLATQGGITTTGGDLYVGGDLYINDDIVLDEFTARKGIFTESLQTKDFNVTGISTFNGDVDLGNSTSDTVTFTGRIDSDILPSTNNTRDLGSSSLKWNEVYATTFVGQFIGNADTAGIATNLKGGSASQIPYQTAADTTAFIPNGTSGQLLQSNGTLAPSWVNATGLSVSRANYADNAGISTNLKGGSASQIPYQSSANTTAFIPNGTSGQLLQSNGTSAPSWVNATGLSVSRADYADVAGVSSSVLTSTDTFIDDNYYLTFVDSNNDTPTAEKVYTDLGIKYNPVKDSLTIDNDVAIGRSIYDSTDQSGDQDDILVSTSSGVQWKSPSSVISGDINITGSWGDFTGVRTDNVTYTNNTGSLIWVSPVVGIDRLAERLVPVEVAGSYAIAQVNGIEVARLRDNGTANTEFVFLNPVFFVPNGSTYNVKVYNNTGVQWISSITTFSWSEFEFG